MAQRCPHCNHLRKPTEVAPDWQCPACERAYAKGSAAPAGDRVVRAASRRSAGEGGGIGKWLLVVAVAGGVFVWHSRSAVPETPPRAARMQPEVVLYATSWCGYCAATRDFFEANGIAYTEHDIETSAGVEGYRKLNGVGVPLIVIGDDTVLRGYNPSALQSELKPWLKPAGDQRRPSR